MITLLNSPARVISPIMRIEASERYQPSNLELSIRKEFNSFLGSNRTDSPRFRALSDYIDLHAASLTAETLKFTADGKPTGLGESKRYALKAKTLEKKIAGNKMDKEYEHAYKKADLLKKNAVTLLENPSTPLLMETVIATMSHTKNLSEEEQDNKIAQQLDLIAIYNLRRLRDQRLVRA
jgi:hypothetical protein